jgi:hypothetical protein
VYEYSAGGQVYRNDLLAFGSRSLSEGGSWGEKKAHRTAAKYFVGKDVDVHYDPTQPGNSVLEVRSAITKLLVFIGVIFLIGSVAGAWAWVLIGAGVLGLLVFVAVRYSRRNPHAALASPAPEALAPAPADDTYRVLVIADESCVDPGFPARLAAHADGRTIEALVIAPAIGSWIGRWTNDESAHVDARKHLDDTVTALGQAGITAMGETGADYASALADASALGYAEADPTADVDVWPLTGEVGEELDQTDLHVESSRHRRPD